MLVATPHSCLRSRIRRHLTVSNTASKADKQQQTKDWLCQPFKRPACYNLSNQCEFVVPRFNCSTNFSDMKSILPMIQVLIYTSAEEAPKFPISLMLFCGQSKDLGNLTDGMCHWILQLFWVASSSLTARQNTTFRNSIYLFFWAYSSVDTAII